MKRSFVSLVAVFLLLIGALPLAAQEQTSSIEGTVLDQSGAALPGVTVEAVNQRGGRYTATTDSGGRYRFPSVQPGLYTVTATLAGMEPTIARNLEARLGESPRVELRMRIGAVTEAVTVTAEAPLVDVTSNAAQSSFRAETFEQLPRGRDFSTIVTFAPSANQNNKSGGISIDGASGAENRYIMDGVDTTNPQTGVQGKVLITDFVDEVQVKSAGYQAEFGGATGGVINVVTKTGTNDFNGTVSTYYSDNSWAGNQSYLNTVTNTVDRGPILQLNLAGTGFEQFNVADDDQTTLEPSITVGGPILKDRLWFYGGYQPWFQETTRTINFIASQGGGTSSYDQEFTRNNYVANLSGAVGSKFLWKGTFNNSGYETENLLPNVNGRSSPDGTLYAPDDELENWSASGYADFVASPQWFFSGRGGRFYRNYTQSGISSDPRIVFTRGSPRAADPTIPAGSALDRASGFNSIPTNSASQENSYTRDNLNFDASWFPTFAGTHRFKAGVQFDNINNAVFSGQQNYLITTFWNDTCDFCGTRGTFGSAGVYAFQTTGDVTSENTGFFIQDSWTTMNDRLTLNLGVRTEEEKVPSYVTEGSTGEYAIQFDYADKVAPRLGFSYDVFGNGRSKAYGSYGKFYDITKLEMPRGSFGGDKWIYWNFSLDSSDWSQWTKCQNVTNNPSIKPTCPGMTLQSGVDLRHISNSAEGSLIDPDLKPMQSEEFSLGFQQELTNTTALGFRYVNKRIIRAIEDVGVHVTFPDGSEAEEFFIANPGEGVARKILEASGCPTCPALPKAKRDYDGYELEFTKRFSNRWTAHASYLYSELRGNYSGLANSDEVTVAGQPGIARTSPNVNRIFDSLFMLFDQNGNQVEGPLGGDRPHSFKAQVAYSAPFGTTVGVNQYYYSGTPTTTEMRFQGAPFFAFNKNDLGRTPGITQTDLNLTHRFSFGGGYALELGGLVLNLFDEDEVTNIYPIYSTTSIRLRDLSACGSGPVTVAACGASSATPLLGGSNVNPTQSAAFFNGVDALRQAERQIALGGLTVDPRYGQPNAYQAPREVRVFARFIF